jgi:guanylate kinase
VSGKKGHLIVVSGPSGVGKTTLIERVLKEEGNILFSVSYTTRVKRQNEVHGKDYYFTDETTFRQMIDNNGFLEWEPVHGYLYGTPIKEISGSIGEGRDVLLDIDVKGALKVKEKCPSACLIFLEPPSVEELKRRLSLRGEKEIEKRMERVREEMTQKPFFTYAVKNDNVDTAYREFQSIIRSVGRQEDGKDNC